MNKGAQIERAPFTDGNHAEVYCRCRYRVWISPAPPGMGVRVGEGERAVIVGGGAPIVVQSMINTDAADVEATARQVAALSRAGSELV